MSRPLRPPPPRARTPTRSAGGRAIRNPHVRAYAALDLGTNNCRLLIAEPDGPADARRFKVVDAFSRIVRLGQGLAETGRLSERAIDRTVEALRICAEKVARATPVDVRCVATEACRRASNCADFVDRAKRETGLALEVISTREEAALAAKGCESLLAPDAGDAFIFDIGGGSTELIYQRRTEAGRQVAGILSAPLGVVTFAERHGGNRYSPNRYRTMIDEAKDQLVGFERAYKLSEKAAARELHMIGTSGTVTTLASVHLGLEQYDRRRVDGSSLSFEEIDAVSGRLANMSFSERAAITSIGRSRADLVVAGAAILQAICELWPVGRMTVADRGLREGIILGLMDRSGPPVSAAAG
jgi:exopolyphosphatase/guanosine-5'-triphosphate,3'-diphosphate pyrophosphatase